MTKVLRRAACSKARGKLPISETVSGTDEQMLQLLEPYAGQRHHAARLIRLGGRLPNRRAHRALHGRTAHL